ncbi:alpha/beta family hydrolase [Aliidiomarina celeris]|uniref:alpha/beta family hydrolase n=1 Tax=Aliidiomarina celeris TaxID=2249428 RepID=UPI000DE83C51|nr:alpha/beta family hydrolase [Aliidiomarina celeris]
MASSVLVKPHIIFSHGAGAGPESAFMQAMSNALRGLGYKLTCEPFPYWQQVLLTGKKRPPNPAIQLDADLRNRINKIIEKEGRHTPIFLIGKSMGARVSFRCADHFAVKGAIGLGFPFHPPGKQDKHRLQDLYNPCSRNLIVQGERDPFGSRAWVEAQSLPNNVDICWASEGNHDLVPPKRSGITAEQRWQQVAEHIHRWLESLE